MARTKKNEQAPKEKEETPKEKEETPIEVEASEETPVVEAEVEEKTTAEALKVSGSKAEFADLIEKYKIQNPVKYEQKKEVLLAQLNALK